MLLGQKLDIPTNTRLLSPSEQTQYYKKNFQSIAGYIYNHIISYHIHSPSLGCIPILSIFLFILLYISSIKENKNNSQKVLSN